MLMTTRKNCHRCGRILGGDSPAGLCPRCLLSAGLEGGAGPRSVAPTPAEIQQSFPQLEILELLGQGGMGLVYKARQRNLDRVVALKLLIPDVAGEDGFAERFAREARMLARLVHPHIVALHEFGESDGLYYLILEYVDGPNLRRVIQDGGLQPHQALAIVPQICEALQFAHDQGVVHRDIKPENVLLDRQGRVKIADFGLAKLVGATADTAPLTRAGQVMGTVHYMAPEQYRMPNEVDHRADIYSLGVVFYEMLTGQLPIGRFAPPSQKVQVDVRLDEVVMRALETEREQRYQHASDVAQQVDTISRTRPAPPLGRAPDARTSRLAVASFLTFPLTFLALFGIGLLAGSEDQGDGTGRVGALLLAALVGLGMLGGLVSCIRIPLSGGRLRGLGWAISGLILNFLMLSVGALLMMRAVPRSPPTGFVDTDGDGFPDTRRPSSALRPSPGPAMGRIVLRNPPEGMSLRAQEERIRELDSLLRSAAHSIGGGRLDLSSVPPLYPSRWRNILENLPEHDLRQLQDMDLLGLPFATFGPGDPNPGGFESASVHFSSRSVPGRERAWVTLQAGSRYLAFPVVRTADQSFRCDVGAIRRGREPVPASLTSIVLLSATIPDADVDGAGSWIEEERLDLRAHAEVLWRWTRHEVTKARNAEPRPVVEWNEPLIGDDGVPRQPFDLSRFRAPMEDYGFERIVVDAAGSGAELIVSNGDQEVGVPLRFVAGEWRLDADLVTPAYPTRPLETGPND